MKTPNIAYSIAFAGPILPGKEEPWRRFLQELAGSHSQEYASLKPRLEVDFRVQRGPLSTRSARRISRAPPVHSLAGPRKREKR